VCGHVNQLPDKVLGFSPGGETRRHGSGATVDQGVVDEQKASIAAAEAVAALQRRRAASSLYAGSRGVIGQRSVLGAAASSVGTGSVLGAAGGGDGGSSGGRGR